ncbi:DUF6542 domain-containing protein [Corynebacterium halotolerans]|uniref:DUF6542 domain-containing protein n=1 Tax=Corynebacterium halotolerans TaxID=225326 RepID=UPI003CFBAFEE
MSHQSPQTRTSRPGTTAARSSSGGFQGIPTWSGPAIVFAALVTGCLLSLGAGSLGPAYLTCFAVAGVLVALIVEGRGLFLTVASLPLLFGVITPFSSWVINRLASTSSQGFSTTSVITAVFPLAEFFPVLISITLGAAVIALLRLWLLNRRNRVVASRAREARRRDQEAERRNQITATRARAQSAKTRARRSERTGDRVTVEELIRRNQRRPDRSVTDDLYRD